MTHPQPTRQRSIILFHLYLYTHRSWPILWILPIQRNLKHWSSPTPTSHDNSLRRLRPSMRTNILLRCHSNYKSIISSPLHRRYPCPMDLRWLFSRQCNTNTILRIPLPPTFCRHRRNHPAPSLSTRNRIKQPSRIKL